MSNTITRLLERNGMLVRYPEAKQFLVFALTFIVINQHSGLDAQEVMEKSKPNSSPAGLPASPATAQNAPPPIEYLINPGDVVDVYVFDVPELTHTYTVSPSGTITVPLLPQPLTATGLTPDQLARRLEEAFRTSGRLQRPEIAVSVKQSIANSVAVEGAVKNPLMVSAMGRGRLVDVFTQCGGLADDAGNTVTITRGSLGMQNLAREGELAAPILTVELKKVMDVSDPASMVMVWPGDRVNVERQKPDVYYVLGEVKTPGGYTIKNGPNELTVLRALALAGDVTSIAKMSHAIIIRKDPRAPQGHEEIKLNLQSILKGQSADLTVQAEDILFVPGSNSKKALHTLESAPGMVTSGAALAVIH